MNHRHLVVGSAIFVALAYSVGTLIHTADAAAPVLKKVRVTNNTTDTGIRARCVGYGSDVHFTVEVPMGMQETETGVFAGHRGIIIYEDLNEEAILADHFKLDAAGLNVSVVVTGSKAAGYKLAYEYFN